MNDRTRRGGDPRSMAEAAFKKATTKPADTVAGPKPVPIPNAKEAISLRLDRDVLERFQETGPGWQERINAVLRKAVGL